MHFIILIAPLSSGTLIQSCNMFLEKHYLNFDFENHGTRSLQRVGTNGGWDPTPYFKCKKVIPKQI